MFGHHNKNEKLYGDKIVQQKTGKFFAKGTIVIDSHHPMGAERVFSLGKSRNLWHCLAYLENCHHNSKDFQNRTKFANAWVAIILLSINDLVSVTVPNQPISFANYCGNFKVECLK